jgi:hypothetical protein
VSIEQQSPRWVKDGRAASVPATAAPPQFADIAGKTPEAESGRYCCKSLGARWVQLFPGRAGAHRKNTWGSTRPTAHTTRDFSSRATTPLNNAFLLRRLWRRFLTPSIFRLLQVDGGFTARYDYALQALTEIPYAKWREFNPEDTIRFYSLRLREAGMIKSNPNKLIADSTDWRFLNELKRELKG